MTRDTVDVLGCAVDVIDMEATVERCRQLIEAGQPVQHLCVNASKLVQMRRDARLAAIASECGLVSADGQSVVWASRWLGRRLPERVAGIDLMERLLRLAEQAGYGVYFLGARQEVLERALDVLRLRYPQLRVVGHRNGFFLDAESDAICQEIQALRPHILFVAMSSPRKEYWLAEHRASLNVPLMMGVGGAVDVVAGYTSRAPVWLQRAGLEWLYRLLQEPRRLAPRYFLTNAAFTSRVLCQVIARSRSAATPAKVLE